MAEEGEMTAGGSQRVSDGEDAEVADKMCIGHTAAHSGKR